MTPRGEVCSDGATVRRSVFAWHRRWWDGLIIFVLTLALAAYRTRSALISPYDEMYYLSYIQYIVEWHLPHFGDVLNTWAREGFSCHLVYPYGRVTGVPCGQLGAPGLYPEGGTNTSAGWPPLYFVVASLIVRALGPFGVDPFEASRLASVLFLASGAGLLAIVARRLGASRLSTIGAVLLLVAAPVTDVLGSFTTPHSATLLISATCLLFVTWALGPKRPSALRIFLAGVALGIVSSLTQPHAIVGVSIAALAIAIATLRAPSETIPLSVRLGRAAAALAAPLTGVALYLGWTLLQAARDTPYPKGVNVAAVSKLPDEAIVLLNEIVTKWWYFLPGALTGDSAGYGVPEQFLANLLVFFAIAGLGAAVLVARRDSAVNALGWALLIVAPLAAIAMDIYFKFPLPLRYGFAVAPVMVALLAIAATSRSARWLVLVAGVGAYGVAYFALWP